MKNNSARYQKGFHVSLLRNNSKEKDYKVILICPNCGYRCNIGWKLNL